MTEYKKYLQLRLGVGHGDAGEHKVWGKVH